MRSRSRARGAGRRLLAFVRAGSWRLLHGRGSPKRFPSGGAVIALVGPEACGKSTLVAEAAAWLGQVFRVQSAHLGKPPPTWLTLAPSLAWWLLRRVAPGLRGGRPAEGPGPTAGRPGLLAQLRAVVLAWDRRALAVRLARKAARGWLVVCDRYPSAVVGAADSARLMVPEGRAAWRRGWLARLEQRLYRGVPAPDLVDRLTAPLAVALQRNQERHKVGKESAPYVTRRHKDFVAPHFAGARTVELDTNRPQPYTVRALRQLLWEQLGSAPPARTGPRDRAGGGAGSTGNGRGPLVVEFIGVTGVGKSTLVAAVADFLAGQGLRAREAEAAILARHELAFPRRPQVRAALVHLLALPPFGRYFFTREGLSLCRLAVGSIVRGAGGLRLGASLLRNYWKRIGSHFLVQRLRDGLHEWDVILCDEGAVQAAHNLFVHTGSEPNREAIVRFARLVPKPDLLVWVTAPTAQSTEVILRRGHSRVEDTAQTARAFAERAQATFQVLASVEGVRAILYRADNAWGDDPGAGAVVRARAATIGEFLIQNCRRRQEAPPARNGRTP